VCTITAQLYIFGILRALLLARESPNDKVLLTSTCSVCKDQLARILKFKTPVVLLDFDILICNFFWGGGIASDLKVWRLISFSHLQDKKVRLARTISTTNIPQYFREPRAL
jgi:hypothetical protein